MTYTYRLIPGGYEILRDSVVAVRQLHHPLLGKTVAIADADRDALAQAAIQRMLDREAAAAAYKAALAAPQV